ncbi:MAG: Rrf2 family transcriptional regulator [Chloroflexi bacterium]|nr:Rrf2 family transcriptional regulator [Chloroflexota bacterium]
MKLSAKERTSLRAMAELARRYGQGPIPLSEVAATERLRLPYLERIAMDLRKAGLVISVRGAKGGYYLSRAPETITVGDIIRAVEHSVLLIDCASGVGYDYCRETGCAAHRVLASISERLEEALDGATLAAIAFEQPAVAKGAPPCLPD